MRRRQDASHDLDQELQEGEDDWDDSSGTQIHILAFLHKNSSSAHASGSAAGGSSMQSSVT